MLLLLLIDVDVSRVVLQSNHLPNGTLFQVKVAYGYVPVHDDELSINTNDIINVTRLVRCTPEKMRGRFLYVRVQVEEGWYEGVLDGKLGLFPSNYVTRLTEETSKNNLVERRHSYEIDRLGSKKDPPMKRKPANGLSALISKEVRVTTMFSPTRVACPSRYKNLFLQRLWSLSRRIPNLPVHRHRR